MNYALVLAPVGVDCFLLLGDVDNSLIGTIMNTVKSCSSKAQVSACAILLMGIAVAGKSYAAVCDFESLPTPTHLHESGAFYNAPLTTFDGFRFTSVNYDGRPEFRNVWGYYTMPSNPNPQTGYTWGVRGLQAAYSPVYYNFTENSYYLDRANGGAWNFAGAWFTSATVDTSSSALINNLTVTGSRNGLEVFTSYSAIQGTQTFVGAEAAGMEIDKLTITCRAWNGSVWLSRVFIMDDMNYTLVPAPGVLTALFFLVPVTSRRRVG